MRLTVCRAVLSKVLRTVVRARARARGRAVCAAFEHAPDGALIVEAASLRILATNAALRRDFGFEEEELRGYTLTELFAVHGDSEEAARQLRDPQPRLPIRMRHCWRNSSFVDVELMGYRADLGSRPVLVYTMHDGSFRGKVKARLLDRQQHLTHLANHDQLTGLPNRLFLVTHLPGAIEAARRTDSMLAVLFLDLDRFKDINDSRGHETGDKLLQAVAHRIKAAVHEEDLVVRMGGDEFAIILQGLRGTAEVNDTASRIARALASPIAIENRLFVTTASIGVSLYPHDGTDMRQLLRRADAAMYCAKEAGRNNFRLFDATMDRSLKERLALEGSLRAALKGGALAVYYQPIVDATTLRVVALEALLRWQHGGRYISPERFIPVAEETGLIVPIGELVLEQVMHDARRWVRAGCEPVSLTVNISAVQLERSDLATTLRRMLRAHRFNPALLQLELTESVIFERRQRHAGESNQEAVSRLRDLGVRIVIDDFGTGYSSLSYLKRWKFDYLKIDRSFIRDLVTDASDLAIVSAILAMAKHLNLPVVAEGVEERQQLDKLRELGCAMAQGFLLARPAPAEECVRYLRGIPLEPTDFRGTAGVSPESSDQADQPAQTAI